MFKFLILISICVVADISKTNAVLSLTTPKLPIQVQFNNALVNFQPQLNNMSVLEFNKRPATNRTAISSNMRLSSTLGKQIHSLFQFTVQFASNLSIPLNSLVINSTYCPYLNQNITCNFSSKYRTNDGTCNNINNYLLGSSNTPYTRVLPSSYQDGFSSARTLAQSGNPLPNPRNVSLTISTPTPCQRLSNNITHLFPAFGQFLTHDISGTSTTTDDSGNELKCDCSNSNPNCISIPVPVNDTFLGLSCGLLDTPQNFNRTCTNNVISSQTCINVTRSSAAFSSLNCNIGYREQLNLLSSFIDGSAIYGMSFQIAQTLRTFTNGKLKTSPGLAGNGSLAKQQILTGRTYLPLSNDTCSASINENFSCFAGGEYRTSENLGLVSMQTLFNREHNRIAAQLALINPSWNDEKVYQETRRLVISELQHITFNEFLPLISGNMSLIPLKNKSYYNGYNSNLNPALANEFSTAAFRMGHSLIRQVVGRMDINQTLKLNNVTNKTRNAYFSSYEFELNVFQSDMAYDKKNQGLNSIALGLVNDYAWKFGSFGNQLQNNLFQQFYANGSTSSYDLLALNINRGRDHGLQPYVKYVQACLNKNITTFADLYSKANNLMIKNNANKLQAVYENVNDIDLYAGGLLETIVANETYAIGPTFACIIMNQFANIKMSDRYYYENSHSINPGAFNLNQLNSIRNITLAGLICNNYDIFFVQNMPFLAQNATTNPIIDCKNLNAQLNLSYWLNA